MLFKVWLYEILIVSVLSLEKQQEHWCRRAKQCTAVDRVSSKTYFNHLRVFLPAKKQFNFIQNLEYFHCFTFPSAGLFRQETAVIPPKYISKRTFKLIQIFVNG